MATCTFTHFVPFRFTRGTALEREIRSSASQWERFGAQFEISGSTARLTRAGHPPPVVSANFGTSPRTRWRWTQSGGSSSPASATGVSLLLTAVRQAEGTASPPVSRYSRSRAPACTCRDQDPASVPTATASSRSALGRCRRARGGTSPAKIRLPTSASLSRPHDQKNRRPGQRLQPKGPGQINCHNHLKRAAPQTPEVESPFLRRPIATLPDRSPSEGSH